MEEKWGIGFIQDYNLGDSSSGKKIVYILKSLSSKSLELKQNSLKYFLNVHIDEKFRIKRRPGKSIELMTDPLEFIGWYLHSVLSK